MRITYVNEKWEQRADREWRRSLGLYPAIVDHKYNIGDTVTIETDDTEIITFIKLSKNVIEEEND